MNLTCEAHKVSTVLEFVVAGPNNDTSKPFDNKVYKPNTN